MKKLIAIIYATVLVFTSLSGVAFAAEGGYIGAERAKTIALEHAGITAAQATFIRAHLDYDDRRVVYDVEFYSGQTEYDYEIDAQSAVIREVDRDIEYYAIPVGSRTTTNAGRYIGEAAARDIALVHAGVTAGEATFIKSYLDSDDGRVVYDVEFYSGRTEYDYEIDAVSGDLVEFDREIEYYSIPAGTPAAAPPAVSSGSYIGEAEARAAALRHAGASEAQATFIRSHLDYDDGRVDYEVDFYVGNTEYEYEIDAVSGQIIEFDMETKRSSPVTPAAPSGNIGEARAKSIALSHANVTEPQTSRLRVKLDRDDGRTVYEVDFNVGRREYEYDIDASNGMILEYDAEYDD